jgi:hypothetical protein
MDTKKLLNTLAKQLDYLNHTSEAKKVLEIIKYSENELFENATSIEANEIDRWRKLLEEVQAPIPQQIFGRSIKYLVRGGLELYEVSQQLKDLDISEIEAIINLAKKASFGSHNSIDDIIKKAELDWTNPAGKGAGKSLKLIPYIGVIFSGALAIKNLAYGLYEFSILVEEANKIGLSWYDTLYPERIAHSVNEYQNSPEDLKIAVKTVKSAKVFVDEGISFVANSIDFAKDFIFLLIEFAVALTGIGAVAVGTADFTSSALIAIVEYQAEIGSKEHYDRVLEIITDIAESNIQNLTPAKDDNIDYSELSPDELLSILST